MRRYLKRYARLLGAWVECAVWRHGWGVWIFAAVGLPVLAWAAIWGCPT